jgi:hypothetical protein
MVRSGEGKFTRERWKNLISYYTRYKCRDSRIGKRERKNPALNTKPEPVYSLFPIPCV